MFNAGEYTCHGEDMNNRVAFTDTVHLEVIRKWLWYRLFIGMSFLWIRGYLGHEIIVLQELIGMCSLYYIGASGGNDKNIIAKWKQYQCNMNIKT